MSNVFGNHIRFSIFGESHGPAVGFCLDGLPPGFLIDMAEAARETARRAPGRNELSTPRAERDEWEILSGLFEGRTTGTPLAAIIRNNDTRSGDYSPNLPRPGHADWTALLKYRGFSDHRGGGHFSGRLTAPVVFAGAIAKQILARERIGIGARICQIHTIKDAPADASDVPAISKKPFPTADDGAAERMKAAILTAKADGDSVGGVIECVAVNLPGGWGDPFFDSVESRLSAFLFSIPAVKAVEFGAGFGFASMRGSEANDQFRPPVVAPPTPDQPGASLPIPDQPGASPPIPDQPAAVSPTPDPPAAAAAQPVLHTATNHNGGVNGGITNGLPLVFRVAVKPTASIGKAQQTVDLRTGEGVTTRFGGRHDPCIVPRAVPVVEAAAALCLLDFMCGQAYQTNAEPSILANAEPSILAKKRGPQ
ncbi:MAG: chorismate synthase [Clostridiales bacterium]|jgi:chorismate synthase|nr:chorismate synthase [Clostridiales bacterium]